MIVLISSWFQFYIFIIMMYVSMVVIIIVVVIVMLYVVVRLFEFLKLMMIQRIMVSSSQFMIGMQIWLIVSLDVCSIFMCGMQLSWIVCDVSE